MNLVNLKGCDREESIEIKEAKSKMTRFSKIDGIVCDEIHILRVVCSDLLCGTLYMGETHQL